LCVRVCVCVCVCVYTGTVCVCSLNFASSRPQRKKLKSKFLKKTGEGEVEAFLFSLSQEVPPSKLFRRKKKKDRIAKNIANCWKLSYSVRKLQVVLNCYQFLPCRIGKFLNQLVFVCVCEYSLSELCFSRPTEKKVKSNF
jgi:hypothetical protein